MRQNHGDTIIVDGIIVKRDKSNEDEWAGDFRLWEGDYHQAIRPKARLYGVVHSLDDLHRLITVFNETNVSKGELAF